MWKFSTKYENEREDGFNIVTSNLKFKYNKSGFIIFRSFSPKNNWGEWKLLLIKCSFASKDGGGEKVIVSIRALFLCFQRSWRFHAALVLLSKSFDKY